MPTNRTAKNPAIGYGKLAFSILLRLLVVQGTTIFSVTLPVRWTGVDLRNKKIDRAGPAKRTMSETEYVTLRHARTATHTLTTKSSRIFQSTMET